jgi:hypothetical protein
METILKLYSVAVERAMVRLPFSLKYLAKLSTGKIVLWCYLIWYLVTARCAFRGVARTVAQFIGNERNSWPRLTVEHSNSAPYTVKPLADVSPISYAILRFELFRSHKRQGYILVLPSRPLELLSSFLLCAIFVLFVLLLKRTQRGVRG